MIKTCSSPQRNVEHIRQKNLADNQLFLKKLLMNSVREDFLNSARSVLRKDRSDQIKKNSSRPDQRVDRVTRYHEKVKSGEIPSHTPEWQRNIQRKQSEKEQRQQKKLQRQKNEMERQERQFEQALKKIESQLKFDEYVQMSRAERHRRHGPSKWELLYQDQSHSHQRPYKLRHTNMNERIDGEVIQHVKQEHL